MMFIHLVPIADITIGDRWRTLMESSSPGETIKFLAESIKARGLIHPIALERETNRLLAGGRRIAAAKLLGWTTIPSQYFDQLDEIQRREIELEENLARKNLSYVEQVDFTDKLTKLKRQIYGDAFGRPPSDNHDPLVAGWSNQRTAEIQGVDEKTVRRNLTLARAYEVMPSLRAEPKQANALRKVDHLIEDLERELEFRDKQEQVDTFSSSLLLGDARKLIPGLPDNSVDLILTDPPYGLGLATSRLAARDSTVVGFDDSPATILDLLLEITPQLRRVLRPGGHLYAFFSPALWKETIDIWKGAGFEVTDIVCIWYKTGAATGGGDWDHSFAPSWEPFLFATDRQRRLHEKHKAVFECDAPSGSDRYHPAQKPIPLLTQLIELSTLPGEIVFDPFMGVGSVPLAANLSGRKHLGYEQADRWHAIAVQRLMNLGTQTVDIPDE